MKAGVFNPFRVVGDVAHLLSFVFLLASVRNSYDASSISLRSQQLLLLVFLSRYVDIFRTFFTLPYLTFMKLMFVTLTTSVIVHTNRKRRRLDEDDDTFPRSVLVAPALVAAAVYQYFVTPHTFEELSWIFSILLESIAIVPQLYLFHKKSLVHAYMAHYIALLVAYRSFYCVNWVVRRVYYDHDTAVCVWAAGIVQNLLLVDFVYYYMRSRRVGINSDVVLPQ